MSDSMRLTDDQITSMLLERVASPMPPDLSAAVLTSVRAAHRQDRLLGRRTFRPGTLLVAAALLIGASALVAGFAGSTRSRRLHPRRHPPSSRQRRRPRWRRPGRLTRRKPSR